MSTNIERNFGDREKYADILCPKGRESYCSLWLSLFVDYTSPQRCRCAGANGEVNYDLLGKILTAKSLEEVRAYSFVRKETFYSVAADMCSLHVRCARVPRPSLSYLIILIVVTNLLHPFPVLFTYRLST